MGHREQNRRYRAVVPPRRVTFSMGVWLDGQIDGPDGNVDWTAPGDEVFQVAIGQPWLEAIDPPDCRSPVRL